MSMVLGSVWSKVVLVGAIVLAVLAILAGARSAGRKAEQVEQMERINEAVKEKAARDRSIRIMSDDDVDYRVRQQRDELRRLLRAQ